MKTRYIVLLVIVGVIAVVALGNYVAKSNADGNRVSISDDIADALAEARLKKKEADAKVAAAKTAELDAKKKLGKANDGPEKEELQLQFEEAANSRAGAEAEQKIAKLTA